MSRRGRRSMPPARRSPRPSARAAARDRSQDASRSCSTARPRTCGRRSSTASPSTRATRRRSAPRSATISTRRSIRPRRCAGPPASTVDDPALPEGVEPLAAHVQAPPELARRLAQIGVVAEGARRGAGRAAEDRPAAGVAAKATSGAGTALSPPPMRRPAPRAGSPSAPGSSISKHELEQARTDAAAKRQALRRRRGRAEGRGRRRSPRARDRWRAAQREADAARERHAATEREINRHAARRSALTEAQTPPRRRPRARPRPRTRAPQPRWPSCRRPTRPRRGSPRSAPRSTAIAASPPRCAPRRRRWRARPSWPTAACRRSSAERTDWQNRKQSAASQIATVEARITEVTAERAEPRRRAGSCSPRSAAR